MTPESRTPASDAELVALLASSPLFGDFRPEVVSQVVAR